MTDLTPKQAAIYSFIKDEIGTKSRAPTVREICAKFAIGSPNGAAAHVRALQRKGLLVVDGGISRGIRLANDPVKDRMAVLEAFVRRVANAGPGEGFALRVEAERLTNG